MGNKLLGMGDRIQADKTVTKRYIIIETENSRQVEKENDLRIIGKVVNNFYSHPLGYITGYLDIETVHPLLCAAFFIHPGTLTIHDVEEAVTKPLEEVIREANERSL